MNFSISLTVNGVRRDVELDDPASRCSTCCASGSI